ncbi:hypothetical protein Btru_038617 [Bulinus truncatus]|nr:hypothetical protein Btru_038617 [Bulinus truncatus]
MIHCIAFFLLVLKIWLDPLIKPTSSHSRAVALLENELDLKTIYYCINQKGLKYKDREMFCDTVTPPQSIIVSTNGAIRYGALDKLKFLFSSKKLGGRKVVEVKKLQPDFFEMIFADGWDAVLSVCLLSWQVNNTELTLCPYFDCYKEPPLDQFMRIKLKFQEYSSQENRLVQDSKTLELFSAQTNRNFFSVRKKLTYFFKNKLVPLLLNLLDCTTAVQTCYSEVMINIDPMEMEAEIEGPEHLIKPVYHAISCDESKISFTNTERQFLEVPTIEEYLKVLVKDKKWYLDFQQTQPGFVVIDSTSNKVFFPDFVKSLLIIKSCLSLPCKDFQDSQEWIIFQDLFNNNHPYQKIVVCNNCVTIMALTYQEQDLNFMVNMVNSKLQEILSSAHYEKESKLSHTVGPNTISISKILEDTNKQVKSSFEKLGVKISQKKIILWLLNLIHLNEAVAKIYRAITMDISEENCEILIEGPTDGIKLIQEIVMSDKNKISLTEEEENLLFDHNNKQRIEWKAKQGNWHAVLDGEIIHVEVEDTDKMTLQRFTSEMLIRSGCVDMASSSYQQSTNLLTFNDNFYAAETRNIPSSASFTILSLPTSSQDPVDLLSIDKVLNNDSKIDSGGKTKRKSFTVVCKHNFFAWLLQALDLESAVRKEFQELLLQINSLDSELHIIGFAEDAQKLKQLIMTLEGKISFTDEEEIFVSNVETLQYVEYIIQKSGLYVDLLKNENKIILKNKNGLEIDFEEFCTSLIIKKKCRPLPTTDYKDSQEWITFTLSLLHETPPGQIIVEGRNVFLYTVGIESDTVLLTSKINDFIDSIYKIKTVVDEKQKESYSSERKQTISVQSLINKLDNLKNDDSVKVRNREFVEISQKPVKVSVADKTSAEKLNEVSATPADEDRLKGPSVDQDSSEIYTFTTHNSTYTGSQSHCTERKCYKILKEDDKSFTHFTRSVSSENQPVADFYPLSPQEYKYCENFLQGQLNQLKSKHNSDIKLSPHGIDVRCISHAILHKILAELKNLLGEIHIEDKLITYPGLLAFFETTYGETLIKKLSADYKCLLEIPDLKLFYSEDSCQNLDYKVLILHTVAYKGFNVHIAFGHISNIKVDMTVDFRINDEVTSCATEPGKNVIIKLPLLKQHDESVKESFKQALQLIIEQIAYLKCQSVAISTAHIHDEENTIYIDYLHEILPKELKAPKSNCDIYIVGPCSKAVYDTFVTVWKSYQVRLEVPVQPSWDKICFPETYKCLDYRSLKIKVTVLSRSSDMNGRLLSCEHRKTLWCYPVLQSLDVSDCSVLHESFCCQSSLEQEIKKFKNFCPKGLSVGDSFQIKSSVDYTDILLYCCPEWGFDSVMAIHDALETVLLHSSDFEHVYIIPPGLHVNPKYPKSFLAWKVFQLLDILLSSEKNVFLQKQIIFIIEDEEYKQAFELQLRKRYSKTKMDLSGGTQDTAKTCKDKSEHPHQCSLRNNTPKQLVSFWGASEETIKEAELFFIKHLDNLMKESEVTMKPDKLFIDRVENIISTMKDMPVSLLLEKTFKKTSGTHFMNWSPWRKSKNHDEEVKSATLYIQGLNKLKELWYDPFNKPVAVAMFEKPIAMKTLEKELLKHNKKVILGVSLPTQSVIVRLYTNTDHFRLSRNLELKFQCHCSIKTMFTSNCYEISIQRGWGHVVTICHNKWTYDREIISVEPYFECFRKEFLHKVMKGNDADEQLALSKLDEPLGASSILSCHYERCISDQSDSPREISNQSLSDPLLSVLLDALNLSPEINFNCLGVKVSVCLKNFTICLQGPKTQVEKIMEVMKSESAKLEHSYEMTHFLKANTVQQQIKFLIAKQDFCIIIDSDTFNVIVKDRNGHKVQLKDVLVHKIFPTLTKVYDRNMLEKLKDEIEYNNKNLRVFYNCEAVVVFGVKEPIADDKIFQNVTEYITAYLKNVLVNSYDDIESNHNEHHASNRPESTHEEGKFKISIKYPGLISFLNSPEGNEILTKLLSKHKLSLNLEKSYQSSPDFKVVILNKAKIGSCFIHLVQGSIQDVNVTKKIIFLPTNKDGECHLKDATCALECNLILPPWRSFGKDFSGLRKSLHKSVDEIFQNIDIGSYTDVAFSTSEIHSAEFPFPLDLIANCILEAINQKRSAWNISRFCNIYIVESRSGALFKAFQYFITNMTELEVPDDDTWSKISYSGEIVYDTITARVEVQTNSVIKAIQVAFISCLQECSKYKTVYIVPPGLHTTPKFPKVYLAQTVCKVLQQLMIENRSLTEKRVIMVVNDTEYKKAFEKELQKYFVHSDRKKHTFISFQTDSHSSNEFIIEGNSEKRLKSFEWDLCNRLNQIMDKNYIEIRLNKNQSVMYKDLFKDTEDLNVLVKIKEIYNEQGSSVGSKFKGVKTLTGSILQIKAFRKQWIEDINVFMAEIASNIPRQHQLNASSNDLDNSEDDEC